MDYSLYFQRIGTSLRALRTPREQQQQDAENASTRTSELGLSGLVRDERDGPTRGIPTNKVYPDLKTLTSLEDPPPFPLDPAYRWSTSTPLIARSTNRPPNDTGADLPPLPDPEGPWWWPAPTLPDLTK